MRYSLTQTMADSTSFPSHSPAADAAQGQKKLLGERLLETGLVTERQLAEALQAQQSTGEQLGGLLVRLGYVAEDQLLRMLCEESEIPFTNLEDYVPDPAALSALDESVARAKAVLPVARDNGRLMVALANPFDVAVLASIERATGERVAPVGAPRNRILAALDSSYGAAPPAADGTVSGFVPGSNQARGDSSGPAESASDEAVQTATVIADGILTEAIELGATDIHIEPTTDSIAVRYRLDGILREGPSFPKSAQAPLLTRIKVLSGLNIAENRLPQDGRLRRVHRGRDIDLRISTFPTVYGEDLVLRVLDRARVPLDLAKLGLQARDLALFEEVLARPSGIILLTGPTGSGKTTTLYAALSELNTGSRCILTLEDPVEYELQGVRQSQINLRAGLTFASGLRSMLRHDPDVILVGEIRDLETAEIALSAAMTGHLVLSTLHTNSAAAAAPRLLDMGTEPYALASSLQLAVAQRLIRVLCDECREETDVPDAVRRRFKLEDVTLYRAGGCGACGDTGYRGRAAIFEFLPTSEALTTAIYERRSTDEIRRLSRGRSLLEAGLVKVRAGVTTLEELLRVVSL